MLRGTSKWHFYLASICFVLYGELSISSTGKHIPLLLGNNTSILVGSALTVFTNIIRPQYFNFEVMKQKILVVDEKISLITKQDSDDQFLKKSAIFSYRIVFVLVSVLVLFWPLPLYFSSYVFSSSAFSVWIWAAAIWVIGSAFIIVIKPLIEGKVGIAQVAKMIGITLLIRLRPNTTRASIHDHFNYIGKQNQSYIQDAKSTDWWFDIILEGAQGSSWLALNVIEWTDEEDESSDSEMTSKIEEEGRRML